MSTNSQNNIDDQEIDLSIISKKIGGFFKNVNSSFFKFIQFILKHKIVIGFLFFLGIGLGLYLDKTNKTFDHQIIVRPNFGSVDYLYSKIDLLQSKIRERDTLFLKSIGVEEPSKLSKIEIKPIIDVYKFVSNNEQNYELLKLMAEDSDMKKIVEDNITSKNYLYHIISFSTKNKTSREKTIQPLLSFLNNSNFYSKLQKQYVNNTHLKIKANEIVLKQIDGFLNNFSSNLDGNHKTDKLVYYNENSPLKDVLKTKDDLIKEQGYLNIELLFTDKIIKENSIIANIENNKAVNGKMKFVLPLLFIFIFITILTFIKFYKKQLSLSKP